MDVAYSPMNGLDPDLSIGLRRYLVVANQTLGDPALTELVEARCVATPARIHVLVPHHRRILPFVDPVLGVPVDAGIEVILADQEMADEAGQRLEAFIAHFSAKGCVVTGEVVTGDLVAVARSIGANDGLDEIIVSTLPAGLSAWLRLDLPARLSRAFDLPVVTITQRN
jgi:hypothetical protein